MQKKLSLLIISGFLFSAILGYGYWTVKLGHKVSVPIEYGVHIVFIDDAKNENTKNENVGKENTDIIENNNIKEELSDKIKDSKDSNVENVEKEDNKDNPDLSQKDEQGENNGK